MAESGGLENRYTRKGIEGSNPSLSASPGGAERAPSSPYAARQDGGPLSFRVPA